MISSVLSECRRVRAISIKLGKHLRNEAKNVKTAMKDEPLASGEVIWILIYRFPISAWAGEKWPRKIMVVLNEGLLCEFEKWAVLPGSSIWINRFRGSSERDSFETEFMEPGPSDGVNLFQLIKANTWGPPRNPFPKHPPLSQFCPPPAPKLIKRPIKKANKPSIKKNKPLTVNYKPIADSSTYKNIIQHYTGKMGQYSGRSGRWDDRTTAIETIPLHHVSRSQS